MAAKGVDSGQNFLINCINDLYLCERAGQRGQQGVVVFEAACFVLYVQFSAQISPTCWARPDWTKRDLHRTATDVLISQPKSTGGC